MRWLKVVFGSMVLAAWPTVIGAGAHWPFGTTAPPDQTFAAYVPRVELREAETAQIVGRMGGTTRALAVTGDRVYAGIGDQLVVFDVSDTHSVLKVGETVALGATVIDLAADGDTVFVAAGAAGLQVFDVSDPSGPRRRAILGLPGSAHGVALCGRHVCVGADEFGLVVVDVMDLDRLRPLGRLRGIGAVRALAAVGSHVFLAQGANALRVVDVGIPSDPHQIGYLADGTPDGTARDIAVAGGHAFVIGDSEGVRIIDIGDPTLPTEAAYVSVGSTSSAVTILGGHAFLADLELGLQVLDITDPAAARLVGEHAVEGGLGAVTAASSRIYAGSGRVNLVAYDAVDPTTPRELARYAPPSGTASVAVGDEHAYVVVDQPEMGLAVVTASPGVPTRLAGFLRLDIEGLRADAVGIGASGRTAYLLYHQAFYQAMQAVDARIPDMPQVTRLLAVPDATAMAVAGDYLYIAGDGLRVVDISQPRNPRQVGYSFKAGNGQAVAAEGRYAYVAQRTVHKGRPVSLWVFDISNAAAPTQIGALADIGNTADLATSSGYVYQVDPGFGLRVFDARDAGRIRQVGAYPCEGLARRLDVAGGRLFLVEEAYYNGRAGRWMGRYGVHVIDSGSPETPQLVQFVEFAAPIGDIAVKEGRLYVAGRNQGLVTIEVPGTH